MKPDQSIPKGAVWSGSILLAIYATNLKVHKRKREQMKIIVNSRKRVNPIINYLIFKGMQVKIIIIIMKYFCP